MQQRDFVLLFGLVLIVGGLAIVVVLIWWSRASRDRQSASGQSSPQHSPSGVGPPPSQVGPVMGSQEATLMNVSAVADRVCMHCGKVVAEGRQRLCNHCGLEFAPKVDPYPALVAGAPPTFVRTYRGAQQVDTTVAFQKDAAELAKYGYTPTTQSWAQGQWGCGAFLVALLLCILLIGFLVFIYMLLVKPVGTLTVTYTRNETVAAPTPAPVAISPASGPGSVRERLAQLDELHGSGVVTDEEYAAKRAKILDEI